MKFTKAVELIAALPGSQAVLLLGPPGTGKTALARVAGGSGDETIVECRDLCSHLPEDLLGLPFREAGETRYAPPAWLARLSRPGATGVLVLDDLAAASPAVQVAAFKLVLERRSGDCTLAPGVRIVATANRREDRSNATALPAALRNRMLILELDVDLEGWCAWAASRALAPEIPAFLRFRPGHLSRLPKDADARGAFATPRAWESLALALPAARATECVFEIAAGLVGEGAATELAAFLRLRAELPDPKEVLFHPARTLPRPPSEPDRLVALVTALGEVAAPLSKDAREGRQAAVAFLAAVVHVAQSAWEYAFAGIATYEANGGDRLGLVAAARAAAHRGSDPRIAELVRHMKESLS